MADDYDALVLSRAAISNYYACDEGSGSTLADSAPTNARPLTLDGGYSWGADLLPGMGGGASVNFTPTAKALTSSTGATGLPPVAGGVAMDCWTIADTAAQSGTPVVAQISSGNSTLRWTTFSNRWWLQVQRAAGTQSFDTGVSIQAGVATYLGAGWDGDTAAYAWVNDQKFTFAVTTPSAVDFTFVSIAANWDNGSPYDGKVSRLAIYAGVQADAIHEEHYDAGLNGIDPGGETAEGSVVLSGGGDVAVSGFKGASGQVTVTGGGDVAVAGSRAASGSVTVSANGDAAVAGFKASTGQVTVSGAGQITTMGARHGSGSVSVSAAGQVTVAGFRGGTAAASVTGGGTVEVAGFKAAHGTVTISGGGDITVQSGGTISGTVTISGGGTVTIRGFASRAGNAPAVTAAGSVNVTGHKTGHGQAAITGAGSITAAGVKGGVAAVVITGGGQIAVTGWSARRGQARLSGRGAITTTGWRAAFGAVRISGGGDITIGLGRRPGAFWPTAGRISTTATGRATTTAHPGRVRSTSSGTVHVGRGTP